MIHPSPDSWGYSGNGSPLDVLAWAFDSFDNDLVIACSFQYTVLLHLAFQLRDDLRIVAVDTGRLPEETYQCATAIERRFNTRIEWYFPDTQGVQELVRQHGYFSFREGIDARKACCYTRKIEPMNRALQSAKAWVSGVRRDQSAARAKMPYVFTDVAHNDIAKICPLLDWSEKNMKEYTRTHNLPYNLLMEKGYTSIGCACCTRPIEPGEDPRAGRWWWESDAHKECGLHLPNWSI